MFKSWRSKEKKLKAVFQLQFQATDVPQLKKPALTVSLVPEEVGKPTFKLEKTAVQEGTCLWENPVYVTVKLVREPKTGKIHEKIYHFIVSSGSSKKDYLGESSIDFADFADEAEPITVSLPLKFANSGAVLHITIQKIQGGVEQRYKGSNEDSHDGRLTNQLSNDRSEVDDKNFAEDLDDYEEDDNFKASVGSTDSFKSLGRQNSMPQRPPIVVNSTTKNRLHRRTSTEWSIGSASDGSLVDSSNSPEDESIEKLKSEIFNLKELSEMETRTLRKQLTKETKRAQDLSREVMDIKEDRDALERECEQLRLSRKNIEAEALDRVRAAHEGSRVKLEEMRKELNHEKELKLNLELQLQKTQESNSELILAVQDLDDMLKEKNIESGEDNKQFQCPNCRCRTEDNESHQAESTNRKLTGEGNDANTNEVDLLKEQITDLSDEIEAYKESRERLEKYIEQLTRDYEDLKQEKLGAEGKCSGYLAAIEEYESQLETLEQKLREQTQEQSEALLHINELKGQVKALEQELENQTEGFHKHLNAITQAKVEEEQRAIRAEEALRKSRWKNASTAERLQDDFKKLSQEMAGKIDENEKLMENAVTESEKLREENRIMEEKLHEAYEEVALIKNQTEVRTEELSNQLDLRTKMIEEISSEAEEKSVQLENLQKQEKERQEALAREIQILKAKIEELTVAGASRWIEEQADKSKGDQDQAKASLANTTLQINELETKYSAAKQEAEKAVRELENLRRVKTCTEQELDNCNLTEILSEMAQLKERNKRMAGELKEMEVMYSDISLKFAEVEGERQQLVMTVRNLKNSKKN